MSRTGSTCARRWPIRWAPQPGLALAASLLLAVGPVARAEWVVTSVQGTPNGVEVWAPDTYTVSTSDGAWLFRPAPALPLSISTPLAVGTYLTGSGCFMAFLRTDGVESIPPNCSSPLAIIGTAGDVKTVKTTGSGAAYAVSKEPPPGDSRVAFASVASGGMESRPWSPGNQPQYAGAPMTMGALRLGSSEHALLASSGMGRVEFHWLVDGVNAGNFSLTDPAPPLEEVQSIELFPGEGTTPTAMFGWSGNLYLAQLAGNNTNPQQVSIPGGPGTVTGVDLNPEAGSGYGQGFGMATVLRPGGAALLSAVPAGASQDIGKQWRANPTLPAGAITPRYLDCVGAKFCVVAQKVADTNNILVYTNASPPMLTVDPDTSLPEGTSRTLAIRVSDLDGDAVRVAVTPSTLSTPTLSMTTTETAEGVSLALSAGLVCQDASFPITVTASDGLQAHDQLKDFNLQVLHTRRAAAPGIATPNLRVQAGGPPALLTVTPPANPPCPIAHYRWSNVTPNAPPLSSSGTSAVFPTPSALCQREGASYVYRVEAVDGSGLASAPTDFTVQVKPWGVPSAPFSVDPQVELLAGDSTKGSVVLTPQSTHACAATAGFPDVATVWEFLGGGPIPPGIKLSTPDKTPITGTSAITRQLRVETETCAKAQLAFSVKHYMLDGSGMEGPASTVRVNVDPQWVPVSEGKLDLPIEKLTPQFISGVATVTGLNCLAQRTGLKAHIRLERADGSLVREGEFPVPGPWFFTLDNVCEAETYQLKGDLLEGSGLHAESLAGGEQDARSGFAGPIVQVPVPPVEVVLKPIDTLHLTAQCGKQATGILEQVIPSGPCVEQTLLWEYDSGPPLTQSSFEGRRVEVTTQEADFGALIGKSVELRVTAKKGMVKEILQPVSITAEPFVELNRHVDRTTGSETDFVGVSVELRNTTECGVGEVEHEERLEGVDYVPGSARFNDVPVEVELDGETLRVRGLVLEGSTVGRLSYVVRPRLLQGTRFEGHSSLRGVSISQPLAEPPVAGCGCNGGGSGFAALGLAGLAVVLRRRRRP